jgi:hypothetical protein
LAYLSHSLKLDTLPCCGWKRVPEGWPARARRTDSRSIPLVITAGMPAAVAISAATTFERIPPEPSGERETPIWSGSSSARSRTSSTSAASGSLRGSEVWSPPVSVRSTSSSAPTRIATCAARKSLSPNEISSVVVVSFSLITGTTRHRSRVSSVWRAFR